jgi:hypothetical protein
MAEAMGSVVLGQPVFTNKPDTHRKLLVKNTNSGSGGKLN